MNWALRCIMIVCMLFGPKISALQEGHSLKRLSRQCIEIWRMMSDLVEQKQEAESNIFTAEPLTNNDFLDRILCALVKLRDMIPKIEKQHVVDAVSVEYVESSLDCIESYSYDLVSFYPGSWSMVIQDQITRAQEAYTYHILPLTR